MNEYLDVYSQSNSNSPREAVAGSSVAKDDGPREVVEVCRTSPPSTTEAAVTARGDLISEAEALRAYASALRRIETEVDAFYFFASMNLMNAYVKRRDVGEDFRKRYVFKRHLSRGLMEVAGDRLPGVRAYLTSAVSYVKVRSYQFSFHNVAFTSRQRRLLDQLRQRLQQWEGVRLQPLALAIFREAEAEWKRSGRARL